MLPRSLNITSSACCWRFSGRFKRISNSVMVTSTLRSSGQGVPDLLNTVESERLPTIKLDWPQIPSMGTPLAFNLRNERFVTGAVGFSAVPEVILESAQLDLYNPAWRQKRNGRNRKRTQSCRYFNPR